MYGLTPSATALIYCIAADGEERSRGDEGYSQHPRMNGQLNSTQLKIAFSISCNLTLRNVLLLLIDLLG